MGSARAVAHSQCLFYLEKEFLLIIMNDTLGKRRKYLGLVVLVCLFFVSITVAQGLEQDEVKVTPVWSGEPYYQDGSGSLQMTLDTICDNELRIKQVLYRFAWMEEGKWLIRFDGNHSLPRGNNKMELGLTGFKISTDATVGLNLVHVGIIAEEKKFLVGWSDVTWMGELGTIHIKDINENIFFELEKKIAVYYGGEFQSPDGKVLVGKAQTSTGLARSYAESEQWEKAMSELQKALDYLEDATAAEEQFQTTKQRTSAKISIKDSNGNSLSGASIESISTPSGQSSLSVITDTYGSANFDTLEPGSYEFKIKKDGYETSYRRVMVMLGDISELIIELEEETKPASTPKSTSNLDTSSGNGGIPGFPLTSVMIGIVVATLSLYVQRQQ